MKKIFVALFLFAGIFVQAQKGANYIQVAGELGIPTGDFGDAVKVGFGGSLKGLLGVTEAGQITIQTGYSGFGVKDVPSPLKANYFIIPILAGYRHNFNNLYVEPQLGMGIYGAKVSGGGESESDSESAFTWAAGFGYTKNGFDAGIRYQSGKIKDADAPFSVVGIHIGYNFPLGHSKR